MSQDSVNCMAQADHHLIEIGTLNPHRTSLMLALAFSLSMHALLIAALALCWPAAQPIERPSRVTLINLQSSSQVTRPVAISPKPPPTLPPAKRHPINKAAEQTKAKAVEPAALSAPPAATELAAIPPQTSVPTGAVVATENSSDDTTTHGQANGSSYAPARQRSLNRPDYPRIARFKGWEGTVVLRINLDDQGAPVVISVISSSGYPVLDEAASATAKQWRFEPARQNGQAVAATLRVPVEFTLQN